MSKHLARSAAVTSSKHKLKTEHSMHNSVQCSVCSFYENFENTRGFDGFDLYVIEVSEVTTKLT